MAWSPNSRCYARQQAAAERSMSWVVTQPDSDVASRPTQRRRAAHPSLARPQSPGAGSGLDTKRSALGAYLSVDTYSTAAAAAVSRIVSQFKIPRQIGSSALGTPPRRQTRGRQLGLGRSDPTRSAAHPARLFAAPDRINSRPSWRLLLSLHAQCICFFVHRNTVLVCQRLFRFAKLHI